MDFIQSCEFFQLRDHFLSLHLHYVKREQVDGTNLISSRILFPLERKI